MKERTEEQKVTRLSIGLVLGVLSIKLVASFFIQSLSFIAELTDAFLDILQVIITYYALRISRRPPDAEHMFGHTKVNSLAGFIESLLIIGLYGGIGYISIRKIILEPKYQPENSLIGIFALLSTIGFVFLISRKIVQIGKETQNKTIIAQGLNFRSDFYRNIGIIVGLGASALFNIGWIDLGVAGLVSLVTIYQGFKNLKNSVNELLDANAFADDLIEEVKEHIEDLPEVLHIDNIAIRTIEKRMDAVVCISLPKDTAVETIQTRAIQVKEIFQEHFPHMEINANIQVNIDKGTYRPEDSHDLFKFLREIPLTNYECSDLHNIIVDNYGKKIRVQFHIRMNPNFNLLEAHTKSSRLEDQIRQRILQVHPNAIIEVISHLETERFQKIHHETIDQVKVSDPLKNLIQTLSTQYSPELFIESYSIYTSSQGNSLILQILFPSSMILKVVEEKMNQIEHTLYTSPFKIAHVLIHPEPCDKQKLVNICNEKNIFSSTREDK